ncbi:hypothetical protein C8J56DRAFT_79575 [Mycena floridula]|nr:hypothetical protein C8J56DRAFT_79575 [Mycena floridula]
MLDNHVEVAKAVIPIQRVPPEILGSIFAFSDSIGIEISNEDISIPAQKLAQVSSHWRDVVFAQQQLWYTLTFDFLAEGEETYSAESITQAVQLALDHSGNFPLNVTFRHTEDDPTLQGGWSLVVAQSHRWKRLSVYLSHGSMSVLPDYFSRVEGALPLLEFLDIAGYYKLYIADGGDGYNNSDKINFFRQAPKLHTVSLQDETCVELALPGE